MSLPLPAAWSERLSNNDLAVRYLLTSDADGLPHLEANDSLHLDANGRLVALIRDEYSATQRNLVRSLWFKRRLAIHLQGRDGRALRLVGAPYKALVSGPRFETHYRELSQQADFTGLSTVWLIDIESAEEVGASDAGRLPLTHLDRIAAA